MGDRCCPPNTEKPEFPPTIILSCREVLKKQPVIPARSTFCFVNTQKFLSKGEIEERRYNWDTFEEIENFNSVVREQLATVVPDATNTTIERQYYKFTGESQRRAFKAGQLLHLLKYPDVSDFFVPYSNKPIPYTSSVLTTLSGLGSNAAIDCKCPNPVLGKPITNEQRIENIKALNTYIKASTHNARFPKSPYRFAGADEYLQYKRYKDTLSQPAT